MWHNSPFSSPLLSRQLLDLPLVCAGADFSVICPLCKFLCFREGEAKRGKSTFKKNYFLFLCLLWWWWGILSRSWTLKQKPAAGPDQNPVPVLGRAGWEVTAGTHRGLASAWSHTLVGICWRFHLAATVKPSCLPGLCVEDGVFPSGSLNLSLKNARELMEQESEKQNLWKHCWAMKELDGSCFLRCTKKF